MIVSPRIDNLEQDESVIDLSFFIGLKLDADPDSQLSLENKVDYDKFSMMVTRCKLQTITLNFGSSDYEKLPIENWRYEIELLSHVINHASVNILTIDGRAFGDIELLHRFLFPAIASNTSITEVYLLNEDSEGSDPDWETSFFTGFGRCLIKRSPLQKLYISGARDEKELNDMFTAFNEFPQNTPLNIGVHTSCFNLRNCREFSKLLASKACSIQSLDLVYNDRLVFGQMEGGGDLTNPETEFLLLTEIFNGLRKNTSIRELELDLTLRGIPFFNNHLLLAGTAEMAYTSNHSINEIIFNREEEQYKHIQDEDPMQDDANGHGRVVLDAGDGAGEYLVEGFENIEDDIESVHNSVAGDRGDARSGASVESNDDEISIRNDSTIRGDIVLRESISEDRSASTSSMRNTESENSSISGNNSSNRTAHSRQMELDRREIIDGFGEFEEGESREQNVRSAGGQIMDDISAISHELDSQSEDRSLDTSMADMYERIEDRLFWQMHHVERQKYRIEKDVFLRLSYLNLHNNKTYVACSKVLFGDLQEKAVGRIQDSILVHGGKFFDKAASVGAIKNKSQQELKKFVFYYLFVRNLGMKGAL